MDREDTRFRRRTGNRNTTRKRSSESLGELQLLPPDRPLFHCQQCGFVNTLIPMCLWCTCTSEDAQHAFELSVPRVRSISTPTRIHASELDMSTSRPSPRAHQTESTLPSFHSGRLSSDLRPLAHTYGLAVRRTIAAHRESSQSATTMLEVNGTTNEHVDNSESLPRSPERDPQNLISTVGISIATSSRPSLHESSEALPVVVEVDLIDSGNPVDQPVQHKSSFDSLHIPENMNSPALTITRTSARRDFTINTPVIISGPPGDDKTTLPSNTTDESYMSPAPFSPRHQHIPTLRRKKTNLNIQTSNLQAKEPIAITLNLHPSPASADGMGKKPSFPQPSPPSALLTTPSEMFTPQTGRLSILESESSKSRLSSLHPPASSPAPSTGGRSTTSSPVRIGHPSRPYYSAIRGPHGISPPSSRPTSTDGLPQRRVRPLSLSQIVTGSTPLGREPGIDSSDSGADDSRTRPISARRHHQSLSIAASSPASPPKYSAFSIPSDSDLEDEYEDVDSARAQPPTPSHGRLFFSLSARSRRRHQRVSFAAPSKRASGSVDGTGSAADATTAMAHGHAHAAFTQSLSCASGKRYRGSSGGMGFSLSGHTELRMALAEGAASAGIEDHAFKFRETGPPPPPADADVGAGAHAEGRNTGQAHGEAHPKGFMNRVRKLRNNLKDMLLS